MGKPRENIVVAGKRDLQAAEVAKNYDITITLNTTLGQTGNLARQSGVFIVAINSATFTVNMTYEEDLLDCCVEVIFNVSMYTNFIFTF